MIERLSAALADRYRIERELGAGGMATVFLAHDIKHERKVAIKLLKPELAAVLGAERFVVEIKTTAALQHPHILPLFDSGTADGFLYYVMPYIQGETIREKLNRETQFGVDEAVRIAREIADALDYAHRHGVIHRDIKPENILLHDGRAMVMDFGIALAVSAAAGGRMTETGLSLGTPHYMSPEQATAEKELTPRSDVYSLASVLYEMLTGNPPHTGATVQQIIMKIITESVEPVTKYRKTVPPNVVAAVARALEKLPADRFESAKAFGDAMANEGFAHATASATMASATPSTASRAAAWGGRRATIAAWTVAAVAMVTAGAGWLRRTPEPPFRRYDLSFGELVPNPGSEVVISPDGSIIAVAGELKNERAIYLRHLDGEAEFRKLAGTETGVSPSFSPDGESIVFRRNSDRSLVKVSVNGGGAVTLLPGGKFNPFFPQWGRSDMIVFSTNGGNFRMPATGGEPVPMRGVTSRRMFVLPDGSGVLHSSGTAVWLYDLKADSSVQLVPNADGPAYLRTGHLLYNTTDGGTFAVTFDLAKHRVTGPPYRVFERVAGNPAVRGYAVSQGGVVVQHDADGFGVSAINQLIIVDPGKGVDTVRMPPGRRAKPRFSADGRMLAMEVFPESRGGATDIYTLDLVTGTYTQLTFDGDNDEPVWSPDRKRILFDKVVEQTRSEELHVKASDNTGAERRLTALLGGEAQAQQWLDDKTLVFDVVTKDFGGEIFTIGADSGSVPVPYLRTPFNESAPRVSPDRKLIAYLADEVGPRQLWLRDFPTPQGKWNVSRGDAIAPRWSPDGKYLYFWRAGTPTDTLLRARIDRTPSVVVQAPEIVTIMDAAGPANWDLHPDGRRFVVSVEPQSPVTPATPGANARWLILENWFSELRRLTSKSSK